MKFQILSVFLTLALASTVQAQFGLMKMGKF